MAEGKLNIDLKALSVVIGVVAALASSLGGYAVLQYRVGDLEDQVQELQDVKRAVEAGDDKVVGKIDEVKCFVAKLHNQSIPGCS